MRHPLLPAGQASLLGREARSETWSRTSRRALRRTRAPDQLLRALQAEPGLRFRTARLEPCHLLAGSQAVPSLPWAKVLSL